MSEMLPRCIDCVYFAIEFGVLDQKSLDAVRKVGRINDPDTPVAYGKCKAPGYNTGTFTISQCHAIKTNSYGEDTTEYWFEPILED